MQNPFLIVRFVFFSLLVYLNIVILIFASWNIHATRSSGASVPGVIFFVIYNCCMVFLLVSLALVELIKPSLKAAKTRWECIWTAILSIFQIGATFSATVNGPLLMCQPSSGSFAVCASSSLLVLTIWFGTMTLFGYFLLLFVTAVTHAGTYPAIWSTTVYSVPWFEPDVFDSASIPPSKAEFVQDNDRSSTKSVSLTDVESGQKEDEKNKPAPRPSIRRGIDDPFIRKVPAPSHRNPPPAIALSPPKPPKKDNVPESPGGSRYVEDFRDSRLPVTPGLSDTISYYEPPLGGDRMSAFPLGVDDHNKPIPLTHLSEWLRADTALGINVHNLPSLSDL
jgi:hypothetical protein